MIIHQNNSDFLSTVLYLKNTNNNPTNWAKSNVLSFENHSFDDVPYYQSQLIDESVNFEIARSLNLNVDDVRNLNYASDSSNFKIVKWLLENINYVTPVQKLNLSFVLSSIGKYHMANTVMEKIDIQKLLPKEQAYYYLQDFLLNNRLGSKSSFDEEFYKIKDILENTIFTQSAEMVFVTQVIAWFTKNKSFSYGIYKWFLERGELNEKILKNNDDFNSLLALSNYYRAKAMIFMETKSKVDMRETMQRALEAANLLTPGTEIGATKKIEALKTYYESSSKEYAYYHNDLESSIRSLEVMEALDPMWSVTFQEKGDIFSHFGYKGLAIKEYDKALNLGGPNYIFTLFKKTLVHEEMNNYSEAVEGYKNILFLDNLNLSSAINGFKLSKKVSREDEKYFVNIIDDLSSKGLISKDIKEEVINHG